MSVETIRRLYGESNVSTVTERGQTVAYRIRIGDRNFVISPREALARMTRQDRLRAALGLAGHSKGGITNGVLVRRPDASSLPLRDSCGIPNCPHDGHVRHADRSEFALKRDARLINRSLVTAPVARQGGSRRGKYPKGTRNVEILATFCAAHGEPFSLGHCPKGCVQS